MKRLLALLAPLAFGACAPQALYFHETTKVAFAADYNASDSQPVASSFGYKRRIVAVVPAQERVSADGNERRATNEGEALSIVSKFHVRVGTFQEGVVITNNFASGTAARVMTLSPGSAATLNALLHNQPIEVSPVTGRTEDGQPGAAAVDQRIERIMSKRFRAPSGGSSRGSINEVPGGGTSRGRIDKVPDGGTSRGRIDEVPANPPLPETAAPADSGVSRGVINSPADVGKAIPKPAPPARP